MLSAMAVRQLRCPGQYLGRRPRPEWCRSTAWPPRRQHQPGHWLGRHGRRGMVDAVLAATRGSSLEAHQLRQQTLIVE